MKLLGAEEIAAIKKAFQYDSKCSSCDGKGYILNPNFSSCRYCNRHKIYSKMAVRLLLNHIAILERIIGDQSSDGKESGELILKYNKALNFVRFLCETLPYPGGKDFIDSFLEEVHK